MNAVDRPIPFRMDRDALHRGNMRSLSRAALAIGLRGLSRTQHGNTIDALLSEDRNADLLVKASTSPTTLANTPALQGIALALVDALIPVSASAALIARSLRLQWDNNAQVKVPNLTVPPAAWLGEGTMIPVLQGTSTTSATLTPFKLATLVELTSEQMRSSNAEAMIRAALLNAIGPALDAAMFF